MRLAKYLAHGGVASRRVAETLIAEGKVSVDGETVRDPARDVGDRASVAVEGRTVQGPEPRVVFALNKPLGVLSTAKDPHGRPTVVELLPPGNGRLYPVGRLDADSTGLILLTNDGELAHRLTHPSFEVPKTYRVKLAGGPLEPEAIRSLKEGVALSDGMTGPARVRRLGDGSFEVTIHEGRNRQVRRMCDAVGHRVLTLERVRFGPLELGGLSPGEHRQLGPEELQSLRRPL